MLIPKAKWIALAGTSINFPKSNINGNGDAYHNWNKDQVIASRPTNLRFQFLRILLEPPSSSCFLKKLVEFCCIKLK